MIAFAPRLLLAFGVVASIAAHAQAGPISYDGPVDPLQTGVYYATASYDYSEAAELFVVEAGGATITGAQWWGGCNAEDDPSQIDPDVQSGVTGTGPQTCGADGFVLTFYEDAGANPGADIAQIVLNAAQANQSPTGLSIGSPGYITEYHYSATFTPFSLLAGTYWLGISSTGAARWGWESAGGEADHRQFRNGSWEFVSNNLAFNLSTSDVPPPTAVPEPASLILLGSGVASVVAKRYRDRRTSRRHSRAEL